MPKMIFMGTNDPYWPVDAVKNYIDSIPGENRICYTPNAGHDMGDKKKAFYNFKCISGHNGNQQQISGLQFDFRRKRNHYPEGEIDAGITD